MEGRRLQEFCDEKELCVANTFSQEKRKITCRAGECKTVIELVFLGKKDRKYKRHVQVIPWELQHRLVVVELDKKT